MPAARQIWIIGDAPFTETVQHLQFWKDKAQQNPTQAMYILKYYEPVAFLPSVSANAVKSILDGLVTALHHRPVPPHTLCIMLDDSNFWCDTMLLDYSMTLILETLLKEVQRIIETRIRDLPLRCIPDYTTRILVSKLTYRPEDAIGLVAGFKEKRRRFNNTLATVMQDKMVKTISFDEITPKFSSTIFHSHGNLAKDGYRQIWSSFNNAIEDLDLFGAQRPKVFNTGNIHAVSYTSANSRNNQTVTNTITNCEFAHSAESIDPRIYKPNQQDLQPEDLRQRIGRNKDSDKSNFTPYVGFVRRKKKNRRNKCQFFTNNNYSN